MSGLGPDGFTPKSLQEIKDDLGAAFRTVFGAAITLIAQSVFGQIIGVVADRLSDLWQLGLNIYTASTREGAVGVQLDNIGLLTGTARHPATVTKVLLVCTGTNGTIITAGSVVSIPGVGTKFSNSLPGTISSGTVTIEFHAVDTGPMTAPATTVTQIETPISGWATASNPADEFLLGSNIETDAAYRLRQVAELRGQGSGTTAAIRSKVGAVVNVTDINVFENVDDLTNADGLPGHTFEVVVDGGDAATIAQVIEDEKPAGIGTYGSTTQGATDANGFAVNVKFSRPAVLNVYVDLGNVTVDSGRFPADGVAQIKAELIAFSEAYHLGTEVRSSALLPPAFAVAGVLELPLPKIGTAPAPSSTVTIVVGNRQKADLDTSRITMTIVPIVP